MNNDDHNYKITDNSDGFSKSHFEAFLDNLPSAAIQLGAGVATLGIAAFAATSALPGAALSIPIGVGLVALGVLYAEEKENQKKYIKQDSDNSDITLT